MTEESKNQRGLVDKIWLRFEVIWESDGECFIREENGGEKFTFVWTYPKSIYLTQTIQVSTRKNLSPIPSEPNFVLSF